MVKEENFELGTLFRSGKAKMETRRNDDRLQTIKRKMKGVGKGGYWQLPKMMGKIYRGSGTFRYLIRGIVGRMVQFILKFDRCPSDKTFGPWGSKVLNFKTINILMFPDRKASRLWQIKIRSHRNERSNQKPVLTSNRKPQKQLFAYSFLVLFSFFFLLEYSQ